MSQWHGGKGSKPRKIEVSREEFDNNWDRIFSKKRCQECGEVNGLHTNRCVFNQTVESPVTENGQDWLDD